MSYDEYTYLIVFNQEKVAIYIDKLCQFIQTLLFYYKMFTLNYQTFDFGIYIYIYICIFYIILL